MTENDRNETAAGENAVDRAEDVRKTRSIRFSDSEWEEVKRAALAHDIPAAEFVRERILALAQNPESAGSGPVPPSMAPLIERMFRYTWFLATENGTRCSARGAKRSSTRWSRRPGRSRNRCAETLRTEPFGRPDGRIAAVQTEIPRIAHVFR